MTLTTGWAPDQVDATTRALAAHDLSPRDAKRLLARTVADLYHGPGAGDAAEAEFDRVFRAHEPPSDIPEHPLEAPGEGGAPLSVAALLHQAGLAKSNREGRRLIQQGGVRLDGDVVEDPDLALPAADLDGKLLQVGKRRWVRLRNP